MTMPFFDNIFEGYAYSYPHKHTYRKLAPIAIKKLWEAEKKDALFLYVHLPFCEMRCGFCNLFTIANPQGNMVDAYLQTLEVEADTLKELIAPKRFAQMAIGGGTPTFLDIRQLEKLFEIIRQFGAVPKNIPVSFEMSPKTINPEKLAFLLAQGVDRVSMGVQSFVENEVKSLGRPQKNKEVYAALDLLKQYKFNTLNIDLIYGAYKQTLSSWLASIQEAIQFKIEEIFIYPLYVRPLTGINKLHKAEEDNRFQLYKAAKERLLDANYEQVSMRMFRLKNDNKIHVPIQYACQEDGMLGIGAGARSYTKAVHYSSEYAVARNNIKSIIDQYIAKSKPDFNKIDYGTLLNAEEQKRRFVIKSLLHNTGLDSARYTTLYNSNLLDDYPQLNDLINEGLANFNSTVLKLTSVGIDYSDAIGPWLYSTDVNKLINDFQLQ